MDGASSTELLRCHAGAVIDADGHEYVRSASAGGTDRSNAVVASLDAEAECGWARVDARWS